MARPAAMKGSSLASLLSIGMPARLARDVGGERQELLALEGERGSLLLLGAADIDAAFEVDRRAALGVEGRVARGHALHGSCGASPWQSAQARPAAPALARHSASPSSTHSMPGLAVSSSCMALVSALICS